ncbi:hypothetical protein MIMGU_mgv1a012342mg [Erythranthe guttata]|uniref:Piwi domain-containing protein n=1 Tax=Erythranthe guttata TaxID=4155 RepID=A0A022RAI8_ERYGU|nr:hypothetical protein MIMGU_mgv1a012342mg [Erythranthe guttata]
MLFHPNGAGLIKRVCETELGIVSQCCQPQNILKSNNHQFLENVSLKINVKVGGRNTVLEKALCRKIPFVSDRPTIIFGAYVTHPQPGDESSPSIAAVVASMDWPEVTKYRALVSAQGHMEEIIQDLYINKDCGMIREHLVAFYQNNKCFPHRLIFYRDGFYQVLLYEVDAIRKSYNFLNQVVEINISCIRRAVPPAYYAHLAAFQARYYIEGGDLSDGGSAAAGPDGVMRERVRKVRALPEIMDNVKDVMFYC